MASPYRLADDSETAGVNLLRVVFPLAAVVLAGCSPGGSGAVSAPSAGAEKATAPRRAYTTPKATAPIRLTVRVDGTGRTARLHLEAVPEIGVPSLAVHWVLPDGWAVASGKTAAEGPAEAGEAVVLDCEVSVPDGAGGEAMAKAVIRMPDGAVLTRVEAVRVGNAAAAKAAPPPLREVVTPSGERLIEAQGTPRK